MVEIMVNADIELLMDDNPPAGMPQISRTARQ
jgi:hypothetical protein